MVAEQSTVVCDSSVSVAQFPDAIDACLISLIWNSNSVYPDPYQSAFSLVLAESRLGGYPSFGDLNFEISVIAARERSASNSSRSSSISSVVVQNIETIVWSMCPVRIH